MSDGTAGPTGSAREDGRGLATPVAPDPRDPDAAPASPSPSPADGTPDVGAEPVSAPVDEPGWTEAGTPPSDTHAATTGPNADPPVPAPPSPAEATPRRSRRPHRTRRWPGRVAAALAVLVIAALGVSTWYLHGTTVAWQDRAAEYLADARGLGADLAAGRADLDATQAELAAVREQLGTAQARIIELADEKAQLGDDREVQRQLVDYQQRVSEAAGQVALALEQCVQGQQRLIGYLQDTAEGTAQYDPDQLAQFGRDVDQLCDAATEANLSLQRELGR